MSSKTQAQSGNINFFDDDEQPPQKTVATSGGDLLSDTSPTTTQPQKSTIESLYQQQNMLNTNALNMMNTNQLLFNTALHQQQLQPQQIGMNISTPATNSPPSTGVPFNTMANLFATSNPTVPTGITMNTPAPMMMNTTTILGTNPTGTLPTNPYPTNSGMNPNFQINSGFQTGTLNLNQLYQTNQMNMMPMQAAHVNTMTAQPTNATIADLTSLNDLRSGQMFPTTTVNSMTAPTVGFNTTVPTTNKDIFDLM